MARLSRAEVFSSDEVAIVHCIARVVRRCFLLGQDPVSGRSFDHRRYWVEELLERFSAGFGIDLIAYAILSNHFHLVLRSRPDIVSGWSDEEIARRWLLICPKRKKSDGSPEEPSEKEIRTIVSNKERIKELRSRLSDISWWMRLLCQRIGKRANDEDGEVGHFFQGRFKAVRLLDEEAVLACAAYVDLNLIRAAIAETIEQSEFTSVRRRIASVMSETLRNHDQPVKRMDLFLAPVYCEGPTVAGAAMASTGCKRASDKGFTWLEEEEYLAFLDGLARLIRPGEGGYTPENTPPIFERLNVDQEYWAELVGNFGDQFSVVAGKAETVYGYRSRLTNRRFNLKRKDRTELANT